MKAAFASAVVGGIAWLALEGAWSLAHWSEPTSSILGKAASFVAGASRTPGGAPTSAAPAAAAPPGGGALLTDAKIIEDLIPDLIAARVIIGQSPFQSLITEQSRWTMKDPQTGLLATRPNRRSSIQNLRTTLFDPLSPLTFVMPTDASPPEKIRAFAEAYGFVPSVMTSNEFGERLTLPQSSAEKIVLVAGDSVALGVMLNDDEHLASQLQRRFPGFRFVNIAISGGSLKDEEVAIQAAAQRYQGRIAAMVYVNFENDYLIDGQTPEYIVNRLSELARDGGVSKVVFVAHQYAQRSMPEVFRTSAEELQRYAALQTELLSRAAAAGFAALDTAPMIETYRRNAGSLLAGAALFVDSAHFSKEGVALLTDHVAPLLVDRGS